MSPLPVARIECVENEGNFGRFVVEPLGKGFGVTLGNTLRRVLLSFLPGAAVTRVQIEGIQHQFSPIPHAKEDTTEFLLNVRALRIRALSGQPGKLTLEVEGEGQVCAADIKPSVDFEIVNPELYLITLDSPEARLYAEFDVEVGEGYREAESSDSLTIGIIPVDAIFTPIRKVNFTVEPTHFGRETTGERLYLEVWTDSTTTPIEAISQSAEILVKQLSPFMEYAKTYQLEVEGGAIGEAVTDERYSIPVEQLDLSVRTMNALRRGGITTVGELISKGEKDLMSLRNFGQKSKQELEMRLNELGLSLKGEQSVLQPEDEATYPEDVSSGNEPTAER